MLKFLRTLLLALLASVTPALAQFPEVTFANLPSAKCARGEIEGNVYLVTNAAAFGSCSAGGSTYAALCICDGGSWASITQPTGASLSGYVPVTKAGQQTITATGAGNDVTVSAADDIFLEATGDARLRSANAAGGTLLLDADQSVLSGPGSVAQVYTDATSVGMNTAGGTILGLSGTTATLQGMLRLAPQATPPAACAGGTEGGLYVDSGTHLLCICNGTAWVQVADGTTGCS